MSPHPEADRWVHPLAEVGPSDISGLGLFAREAIEAGEELTNDYATSTGERIAQATLLS